MTEPLLFRGGVIRTMDGPAAGEPPEAVLVLDGRILAVGTERACREASVATPREIGLDGRCLMPGFVDAHAHLILHGSGLDWADLSAAKSVDDVVTLLTRHAEQRPDAAVIRGYGYDQSLLAERRHPAARDLDRVSGSRPVQIQHVSGHGYVVSSRVLRELGITAATAAPPGGSIGHDAAGQPDGRIFDAACDLLTGPGGVKITNHGPNFHLPMTAAELARLADLAQCSFLAAGVTTICDAQVTRLELGAYLAARDDGRLRLRAQLLMLSSGLEQLRELGLSARLGDDRLAIAGVKFYADGSVIARTAYLEDELPGGCCGHTAGDAGNQGYLYHDPAELTGLLTSAAALGLPTATHAQGSVPIGLVLDAIGQARRADPASAVTHRIEHCGFPTDAQIARMKDLRIVPVPQPMQVHERADALMAERGAAGGRFYPYGLFARAGLPVIVSSDAPVTSPAPLRAAWSAITRQTAAGAQAGGDELRVSRQAALRGVTCAPADLLGLPGSGRITPGGQADLVLLDADPVSCPLDDLPRIAVTQTWVAGAPA